MPQTIRHTRQRYTSEEENDQDDIWECGGHIYDLSEKVKMIEGLITN